MSRPADGKLHLYATTFVVAVVWIVLDQATKTWVVRQIDGQPLSGQLLGDYGWWRLRAIGNPGAAFSLPIELPLLFVGVAVLVTILVIRALPDTESPVLALAYGLVVGGAFGNALDRIFRGGEVVDMIDLQFPPVTDFPVFNVADVGITVGAVLVAILMIQQDRRAAKEEPAVIEPLVDHTQDTDQDTDPDAVPDAAPDAEQDAVAAAGSDAGSDAVAAATPSEDPSDPDHGPVEGSSAPTVPPPT